MLSCTFSLKIGNWRFHAKPLCFFYGFSCLDYRIRFYFPSCNSQSRKRISSNILAKWYKLHPGEKSCKTPLENISLSQGYPEANPMFLCRVLTITQKNGNVWSFLKGTFYGPFLVLERTTHFLLIFGKKRQVTLSQLK